MNTTGTEVEVHRLPRCDYDPSHPPAHYDAKSKAGPWGYMCEGCFRAHAIGVGLGKGQRLIQTEE